MESNTNILTYGAFAYALVAVVSILCAALIRLIVVILAAGKDKRAAKAAKPAVTPVLVSVTPGRDQNAEIAAAIAAAVYAVLGGHRLVYIGEARPAFGWTTEIRTRLHTSHTPRLDRH